MEHTDGLSSLPPFEYEPLPDARSIRVLKICRDDMNESMIRCSVRVTNLDQCGEFDALSYTWGAATCSATGSVDDELRTPTHCIECNSMALNITQNLFDALRQLRNSGCEAWLWVDAIAINQNDLDERAKQVLLMGDVFSRATNVRVWLGKDTTQLEAFRWVNTELHGALMAYEGEIEDLSKYRPSDLEVYRGLGLCVSSEHAILQTWVGYWLFVRCRRFFRRAWIVQEVALARNILVQCAETSFPWDPLWQMSNFLVVSGWSVLLNPTSKKLQGFAIGGEITQLSRIREVHHRRRKAEDSLTESDDKTNRNQWFCNLEDNLAAVRSFQASDKRDKIYAVLGLMSNILPAAMDMPLVPDYTAATENVYIDATTAMLTNMSTLSTLSMVEDRSLKRLPTLPSWVPDYSSEWIALRLPCLELQDSPPFDCSLTETRGICKPRVSQSILSLRGSLFDKVVEVCSSADIIPNSGKQILELCLNLPPWYSAAKETRLQALMHTLVASSLADSQNATSLVDQFAAWLQSILSNDLSRSRFTAEDLAEILEQFVDDEKSPPTDTASVLPSMEEVISWSQLYMQYREALSAGDAAQFRLLDKINIVEDQCRFFRQRLQNVTNFRTLCVTASGALVLAPKSTVIQDQIFVIEGAKVPFVLRRVAGTERYTLIGECYVRGYMHGEMLTDQVEEGMGTVEIQ